MRGSGESAPSDTDASSEVERPGPGQPLPAEPLDDSKNPTGSSASGPGAGRTAEETTEDACPAEGSRAAGPDTHPGPAPTPAELPWTNIDLKEPKKVPSHSAAGFPETSSLSSLGLLPLGLEEPYGVDDHPLWAWVSGGGCMVEACAMPRWFTVQAGKGSRRAWGHPHGQVPWGCGVWEEAGVGGLGQACCPPWMPPCAQQP